jgi:hypothetical protein
MGEGNLKDGERRPEEICLHKKKSLSKLKNAQSRGNRFPNCAAPAFCRV